MIQPEEQKLEGRDSDENPAVLIVDDDPMNIEVLTSMFLSMRNMQSDTALSSFEALNLIRTRLAEVIQGRATMYKMIMLDYSIDEMDGPQIAIAIR